MVDFTILVLKEVFASSVASTLDLLQTAARLAPALHVPAPRWRVLSPQGGPVPLGAGLSVSAQRLPSRYRQDASCWVVPGLALANAADVQQRLARPDALHAAGALQAHSLAGGQVAASCTGVFLLQAAGLLVGHTVTTSWWMADTLRRLTPGCRVDADLMVAQSGSVVTAGAALAQTDLMLHLLRTRCSLALADRVARVLLISERQAQADFVVPAMLSNGNTLMLQLVKRIESALPNPPSVATLADELAMAPRTLARYVQAATGKSPLALIQSVRLSRARHLLENSRLPLDQVAAHVGYADATALRRLTRKLTGNSPGRLRPARVAAQRS